MSKDLHNATDKYFMNYIMGAGKDKAPKLKDWNLKNTDRSKTLDRELKGIVFTKEEGVKFNDGTYLLCLDLDSKEKYGNTPEDKEVLKKDVIETICNGEMSKAMELSGFIEETQNNGIHLWLRIKDLENFKPILVCKNPKREIEIFTQDKFVVIYDETIIKKLDKAPIVDIEDIKALRGLEHIELETNSKNEYDSVEITSRKNIETIFKNLTEKIAEFKSFVTGGEISNPEIREIARVYMFLNAEDEFTKLATTNWNGKYSNQWRDYCKNYLKSTQGNRLPKKGSDHHRWLKSAGAFAGVSNSKKELLKDSMYEVFDEIIGNSALRIDETMFIYNGKSYKWLDNMEYGSHIHKGFKTLKGEILNRENVVDLEFQFKEYVKEKGKRFNINNISTITQKVPLAFKNGTLYVHKDGEIEFKENQWDYKDYCFIEFNFNYQFKNIRGSILEEWINARFETLEKKKFFAMSLGAILSTTVKTEVHPFFYGKAKIGKSTIADLLSGMTIEGTVAEIGIEETEHQFGKVATLRSPLIITDEISNRQLKQANYKKLISRNSGMYELKGIQPFRGQPIAKFLSFANHLPSIEVDGAVERRLLTMELSGDKVRPELNREEFQSQIMSCKNELIHFITEGIKECFKIVWDLDTYYEDNFRDDRKEFKMVNNSFEIFLESNIEITGNEDDFISTKDIMELFNNWRNSIEGSGVKNMTITTLGKKLNEIKELRKTRKKIKGIKTSGYLGLTEKINILEDF